LKTRSKRDPSIAVDADPGRLVEKHTFERVDVPKWL
jgi:hypothetical protein